MRRLRSALGRLWRLLRGRRGGGHAGSGPSAYYDLDRTRGMVEAGRHREAVGGLWDEIGLLTRDLLVAEGLTPGLRFLDVGCGSLRVGVHLVEYLDAGHYFGTDLSADLLAAGYERELAPRGLADKLPRANLLCDAEFAFDRFEGEPRFDMALAQSVFTHLPLNHLRLCLVNLAPYMPAGARFFATVFHCRDESCWARPIVHRPGGVTTYPARDPYHYRSADLEHCARGLDWSVEEPRSWNHPRDQALVVFTRSA